MASHIGLDNVIIFLTFYYTDVGFLRLQYASSFFWREPPMPS
ncbi:hypothetical protein [Enterobacter cloacae complex sp. 379K3]